MNKNNYHPRSLVLSALLLCMITSVWSVRAETVGTVISSSDDGIVSITIGDWPPYITKMQKHNGVIAHIIRDVFGNMGLEVQYQNLPWARAYEEAASGRFNATGVWMHKKAREKDFIYSDPILKERFVFFHLKEKDFDWNTISDLKGITMGGLRASSYGPEMDVAIKAGILTMTRVTRSHQNFARLLLGRIDMFPLEVNVGYSLMKQHVPLEKQDLITHHPKALLENFSYVLFPKKNKESELLVAEFNKQLSKFRKSGLYERYMSDLKNGKYELDVKLTQ